MKEYISPPDRSLGLVPRRILLERRWRMATLKTEIETYTKVTRKSKERKCRFSFQVSLKDIVQEVRTLFEFLRNLFSYYLKTVACATVFFLTHVSGTQTIFA